MLLLSWRLRDTKVGKDARKSAKRGFLFCATPGHFAQGEVFVVS